MSRRARPAGGRTLNDDESAGGSARAQTAAKAARADAAIAPARVASGAGASLRMVEEHSGLGLVLGSVSSVACLLEVVTRCAEGGRPGARFPLVQLLAD